jgi:hypothetical protein
LSLASEKNTFSFRRDFVEDECKGNRYICQSTNRPLHQQWQQCRH